CAEASPARTIETSSPDGSHRIVIARIPILPLSRAAAERPPAALDTTSIVPAAAARSCVPRGRQLACPSAALPSRRVARCADSPRSAAASARADEGADTPADTRADAYRPREI